MIGLMKQYVLGLSKDSVGSHMNYQAKHSIGFSLVSDPEHQFAKAAGSLVEKKMYGKAFWGPTRSAYVLDESATLLELDHDHLRRGLRVAHEPPGLVDQEIPLDLHESEVGVRGTLLVGQELADCLQVRLVLLADLTPRKGMDVLLRVQRWGARVARGNR